MRTRYINRTGLTVTDVGCQFEPSSSIAYSLVVPVQYHCRLWERWLAAATVLTAFIARLRNLVNNVNIALLVAYALHSLDELLTHSETQTSSLSLSLSWISSTIGSFWVVAWLSGNALVSINVVTLRRTRLILGWVTACGWVNHLGEYQPSFSGWGYAGRVHLCRVAGNTVYGR